MLVSVMDVCYNDRIRACKERVHLASKYEQNMNLSEMALKILIFRIFRKTLAKMESQSLYLCGVAEVRVEMKVAPFRALPQNYERSIRECVPVEMKVAPFRALPQNHIPYWDRFFRKV